MKTRTFIGGFLAGTAVGIGLGLLINSLSQETRDELINSAKGFASSVKDTALGKGNIPTSERAQQTGKRT